MPIAVAGTTDSRMLAQRAVRLKAFFPALKLLNLDPTNQSENLNRETWLLEIFNPNAKTMIHCTTPALKRGTKSSNKSRTFQWGGYSCGDLANTFYLEQSYTLRILNMSFNMGSGTYPLQLYYSCTTNKHLVQRTNASQCSAYHNYNPDQFPRPNIIFRTLWKISNETL